MLKIAAGLIKYDRNLERILTISIICKDITQFERDFIADEEYMR